MKICIIGASGKLGRYMVQHALDRGHQVVGVCRERSVGKLDPYKEHITVVPGATNDPEVRRRSFEVGASAFVFKMAADGELLSTVKRLCADAG